MEKRVLLAVALSFLVMVGWLFLFPPPKPHPLPPAEAAVPASSPAPAVTEPVASDETAPAPAPVAAEKAEEVRVETDLFEVALTNRGARVTSWSLRAFPTSDGRALELVPRGASVEGALPLAVDLDDAQLADKINQGLFQVEREPIVATATEPGGERVLFRWADGVGVSVVKSLTFRQGDYLVDLALEVSDHGRAIPARLSWGPGLAAGDDEASGRFHYVGQAVVNDSGKVVRVDRRKAEAETRRQSAHLLWAGLEEQYFAALILPAADQADLVIRPTAAAPAADKKPDPELLVAVSVPKEGARLFVGPKKFTLLKALGNQLESVVWFSDTWLISWLAKMFLSALIWIHGVAPNYGLAVILLTVAVRVALFPVNQYSMVNMRKMQTQMQRIQPKINAIKSKYKKKDAESRSKINQETMALYQKEGINPMGGMTGCLPMLAQFPILIAFYDMLVAAVELRGAPFVGWIGDLTQKDPLYITPILMGATMFIQQWMGTTKVTDPAQAQQQKIMLMMPVVFTVMFLNLPSGLVLYWFVNNLLGIAQQWLVNRHMGRLQAAMQKA